MWCFRPVGRLAVMVAALCIVTACTDADPTGDGPSGAVDTYETEQGHTTASISSRPALPANALFATGGDIDQQEGLELIWVDDQHTLHAGSSSISIEVPNASPYFVNEQAELRALNVDDVPLIVFVHPERGDEDPGNLYQLFSVTDTGLDLVYKETLGHLSRLVIESRGASYVESWEDACVRAMQGQATPPVVTIEQVFLGPSPSGAWHETSREDTTETWDCQFQPG